MKAALPWQGHDSPYAQDGTIGAEKAGKNPGSVRAFGASGSETVTAQHTRTLPRLTAQDVIEISRQFPEIGEYLNELKQNREGGLDHQH